MTFGYRGVLKWPNMQFPKQTKSKKGRDEIMSYLVMRPQYHSASCRVRGESSSAKRSAREILRGGSAGALTNSGSFSPHCPCISSISTIRMCVSVL